MPIINITKKEHIKEYNEHIKDIIDNLERNKDIYSICSYLINISCEGYFRIFKMNNQHLRLSINILIHIKNAIAIIIALVIITIRKKLDIFFLAMNIENFVKKL